MIISKVAAGRLLGISKQAIQQMQNKIPRPGYFVEVAGKFKVETEHPDWLIQVAHAGMSESGKQVRSEGKKKSEVLKGKNPMPVIVPENNPEMTTLEAEARTALFNDTIYSAKIKEEKAAQAEIKTMEMKKDLGPIYLLKHIFDFMENMIHRGYRRYHEIMPEISALVLAGKIKDAEQLLTKEQETLVYETQTELIKSIKDEGFDIKKAKGVKL